MFPQELLRSDSTQLAANYKQAAECSPSSVRAVSNVVKLASENDIDFGIRTGHWFPFWGMSEKAICITLGKLKKFEFDPANHILTVGAGVTKAEAEELLSHHGNDAVVSTTNSATTLIGAALEGGQDWLSGKHGLALDNMLGAMVVLADGNVLKCSATENQDLFWAIKGAGCNFGAVVEATFRTHEQPAAVYMGVASYPVSDLKFVVDTVAQLYRTLPQESRISMRLEVSNGSTEILLRLFHSGARCEANAIFAPLILGAATVKASMMPYREIGLQYNGTADHASGNRWASAGVNIAGPWLDSNNILAMCSEFCTEAAYAQECGLKFAVLGIDIQNMDQINKVTLEDSAFAARHAGAVCYSRLVWDGEKDDHVYEPYVRDFGRKWTSAIGPKDGVPIAYPAFCGPGKQLERGMSCNANH